MWEQERGLVLEDRTNLCLTKALISYRCMCRRQRVHSAHWWLSLQRLSVPKILCEAASSPATVSVFQATRISLDSSHANL